MMNITILELLFSAIHYSLISTLYMGMMFNLWKDARQKYRINPKTKHSHNTIQECFGK